MEQRWKMTLPFTGSAAWADATAKLKRIVTVVRRRSIGTSFAVGWSLELFWVYRNHVKTVMAGLVPAIHEHRRTASGKWMAATGAAMTARGIHLRRIRLMVALCRLDRGAEGDRVGDRGKLDGVDARAFDADMAIAEHASPETLIHLHTLDVVDRHFLGMQREEARLHDEAVGGDADLGGPFADHHGEEDPDADDHDAEDDQRRPGRERVPPVELRLGHQFLIGPERLLD